MAETFVFTVGSDYNRWDLDAAQMQRELYQNDQHLMYEYPEQEPIFNNGAVLAIETNPVYAPIFCSTVFSYSIVGLFYCSNTFRFPPLKVTMATGANSGMILIADTPTGVHCGGQYKEAEWSFSTNPLPAECYEEPQLVKFQTYTPFGAVGSLVQLCAFFVTQKRKNAYVTDSTWFAISSVSDNAVFTSSHVREISENDVANLAGYQKQFLFPAYRPGSMVVALGPNANDWNIPRLISGITCIPSYCVEKILKTKIFYQQTNSGDSIWSLRRYKNGITNSMGVSATFIDGNNKIVTKIFCLTIPSSSENFAYDNIGQVWKIVVQQGLNEIYTLGAISWIESLDNLNYSLTINTFATNKLLSGNKVDNWFNNDKMTRDIYNSKQFMNFGVRPYEPTVIINSFYGFTKWKPYSSSGLTLSPITSPIPINPDVNNPNNIINFYAYFDISTICVERFYEIRGGTFLENFIAGYGRNGSSYHISGHSLDTVSPNSFNYTTGQWVAIHYDTISLSYVNTRDGIWGGSLKKRLEVGTVN